VWHATPLTMDTPKTCFVHFRVTPEEHESLAQRAKARGISKGDFARERLFATSPDLPEIADSLVADSTANLAQKLPEPIGPGAAELENRFRQLENFVRELAAPLSDISEIRAMVEEVTLLTGTSIASSAMSYMNSSLPDAQKRKQLREHLEMARGAAPHVLDILR
jgi:hypothetical protein